MTWLDAGRSREPIPVTVIGGYLGAGKTTLLNAVLARPGSRRIGVVVNDFGALGVDAGLVRSNAGDSPVVNLANGCVCCTLGDDLGATLRMLVSVDPPLDHIVVEASGVADPTSVAAWGTVAPFASGGVVVVAAADSVRRSARDRYVGTEVLRQLSSADLIIVTKVDLVGDEDGREVLSWIASIATAPIVESVMGDVDADVVLGPTLSRAEAADRLDTDVKIEADVEVKVDEAAVGQHATVTYVRWAWDAVDAVEARMLHEFLDHLPDGLLRLKGVVSVVGPDRLERRLLQVVGRTRSVGPVSSSVPVGIEAIGVKGVLDLAELEVCALRYLQRR